MNRLFKTFLLLIIFFLTLSSCTDFYDRKVNHLVGEYKDIENIVIEQIDNNCCKLSYDENNVIIYRYEYNDNPKHKHVFDSLSIIHSDINYNGNARSS